MASFKPHINIPTAIDNRNTFDLSCDHVTTMNFMESRVIYAKEVMPGESLEINVESFCRLSPLVVPTFGRMSIVHRAFFVPFRTVWPKWNAFITDSLYNGSVVSKVPCIKQKDLLRSLTYNDYSVRTEESACDFTGPSATEKFNFTDKGRSIYNLLVSLGYKLTFVPTDNTEVSLLPLLCYVKALRDWIFNENFGQLAVNTIDGYLANPESILTGGDLKAFYDIIYENVSLYQQDVFTSAFVNPTGPNNNLNNHSLGISNINHDLASDSYVEVYAEEGYDAEVKSDGYTNQFILDALKHVSDYLKRHQLVGSKIIDRYLAHYGVKLDPATLNRSYYLGKAITNIQVGDIMSTADTDGAVLGQYAGRGLGYDSSGKFSLSSVNEFGYIVVISQVVPKIGYVEGINRMNMHITPHDFFTPEFDGLGNRAIARKELFVSPYGYLNDEFDADSSYQGIFGYSPQYSEYKVPRDMMSGNYLFGSSNVGEDAWYLFRKIDSSHLENYMEISENFVNSVNDRSQFNRIFNGGAELGVDPFRCIFHFDVKASLPTTKLFDEYEWHERGKLVSEIVNGSGNLAGNE